MAFPNTLPWLLDGKGHSRKRSVQGKGILKQDLEEWPGMRLQTQAGPRTCTTLGLSLLLKPSPLRGRRKVCVLLPSLSWHGWAPDNRPQHIPDLLICIHSLTQDVRDQHWPKWVHQHLSHNWSLLSKEVLHVSLKRVPGLISRFYLRNALRKGI